MTPAFILTDSNHTLTGVGTTATWGDAASARAALSNGEVPLIVGALPFHHHEPAALFTPERYWFNHGPARPVPSFAEDATAARPSDRMPVQILSETDHHPREVHTVRVRRAVDLLRMGAMDKIVLSRAVQFHLDHPVAPRELFEHYVAGSGTGHGHLVDLSSASARTHGHYLVGSSPELLIAKRGRHITSHPLAGTAPRSADPVKDQALATELLLSEKNRAEHAYATSEIRRLLTPYCSELYIPRSPSLTSSSHTWHLGTPMWGTLKDESVSALELAEVLHPTPAVGGYPTQIAQAFLAEEEADRGFYAGALGWSDKHGNGEWRVTIRSAIIDGDTVTAHAGGGIVAESDPETEFAETETKLGPVRAALTACLVDREHADVCS